MIGHTQAAPLEDVALVEAEAFSQAISRFVTGIAVISCIDREDGEAYGVTVRSLTSLSLAPPTVMVSLKPGKAHRLITRQGAFGISILAEEQRGVSRLFSGKPQHGVIPKFGIKHCAPTLVDSLAWFECQLVRTVSMDEHTLFVGEVKACDSVVDGHPLVMFSSRTGY